MEASSVDYRSDFSEDEGREKKILFSKRLVRSVNSRLPGISSLPPGAERVYEDPYQRHRKYIAQYLKFYKPEGDLHKHDKDVITERDIVKAENRFVWNTADEESMSWEKKLAKKYYDRLFKEYALCNLSLYKKGNIALRWRTKNEVIVGKGQFICGCVTCKETDGLQSWEVNFRYEEYNEIKNALVKIRLCSSCSFKLNYKHQKKKAKQNLKQTSSSKRIKTEVFEEIPTSEKLSELPSSDAQTLNEKEHTKNEEAEIWKRSAAVDPQIVLEEDLENYFLDLLL